MNKRNIIIMLKKHPFLRGMVRAIDIGCYTDNILEIANTHKKSIFEKSDEEKLKNDWENINKDFVHAIDKFRKTYLYEKTN